MGQAVNTVLLYILVGTLFVWAVSIPHRRYPERYPMVPGWGWMIALVLWPLGVIFLIVMAVHVALGGERPRWQ